MCKYSNIVKLRQTSQVHGPQNSLLTKNVRGSSFFLAHIRSRVAFKHSALPACKFIHQVFEKIISVYMTATT